jgi:hypothetical protein
MGRINTLQGFSGLTSLVGQSVEAEFLGATMVFAQPTSPTGWTKITTYDDYGLRVVNGSTGGTATGTTQFSTTLNTTKNVFTPLSGTWPMVTDVTTLSVSQMEAHSHPTTTASAQSFGANPVAPTYGYYAFPFTLYPSVTTSTGTGGGHAHTASLTAINYTNTFALNVKYVDVILAKYH